MSLDSMSNKVPLRDRIADRKDLNKTLTQFYLDHGRFIDPEDWFDRYPYHEAFFDDKEEWMKI